MKSPFGLSGKAAIITGSSRGIGRAIAAAMAVQGANVVISSRKEAACAVVAEEINALGGGKAISIPANIASKADLEALADGTRQVFSAIDIVVGNAASNRYYGPMHGITDDQFEKILRNNILSNHWLVQLSAPEMRAQRDAAIIIISSIGGYRGSSVAARRSRWAASERRGGR